MMKHEFEALTGSTLTDEQYETFETMYMAVSMSKQDFAKMMLPSARAISRENEAKAKADEMANQRLVMVETDGRTPNGCYSIGYYAKVIGADIKTGKILVRNLTEAEYAEASRYHSVYWHDDRKEKARGFGYRDYYGRDVKLVG